MGVGCFGNWSNLSIGAKIGFGLLKLVGVFVVAFAISYIFWWTKSLLEKKKQGKKKKR